MIDEEKSLENARYLRDLVFDSQKTQELVKLLLGILEAESVRTLVEMGDGHGRHDPPFTYADYVYRSGLVQGLKYLEKEINWQIHRADEADRRDSEKE